MVKLVLQKKQVSFLYAAKTKDKDRNGKQTRYYSGATDVVPGSPDHELIMKTIMQAATEKWKGDAQSILGMLVSKQRCAYRFDELCSATTGKPYPQFVGKFNLGFSRNAAQKPQPLLFDSDLAPMNDTALKQMLQWVMEGKHPKERGVLRAGALERFYSGGIYNLTLDIWAQDNPDPEIGKRINCDFMGIQFAGEGDHWGVGASVEDDDFQDNGPPPGTDLSTGIAPATTFSLPGASAGTGWGGAPAKPAATNPFGAGFAAPAPGTTTAPAANPFGAGFAAPAQPAATGVAPAANPFGIPAPAAVNPFSGFGK